jgi:hypothetical protein
MGSKTMKATILTLLTLCAIVPALGLADNAQVYKWTDAAGVVHYSDKPPVESVADVQTLDMPALPYQDPAQLAAQQAALVGQAVALQQLQVQAAQQQQAADLARQQAELAAALAAFQQAQAQAQPAPETMPLIYSTSAFVPAAYRANFYLHHPHRDRDDRSHQRPPVKPAAISLYGRP